MELAIPLMLAGLLGLMPIVMYYFGWLAGRPRHAPIQRLAFMCYICAYAGLLGASGVGLFFAGEQQSFWLYVLPMIVLLVLAPTLAIWFFFGAFQRRPHHCPTCGYDLHGNISGRCPECGMQIADGPKNHG